MPFPRLLGTPDRRVRPIIQAWHNYSRCRRKISPQRAVITRKVVWKSAMCVLQPPATRTPSVRFPRCKLIGGERQLVCFCSHCALYPSTWVYLPSPSLRSRLICSLNSLPVLIFRIITPYSHLISLREAGGSYVWEPQRSRSQLRIKRIGHLTCLHTFLGSLFTSWPALKQKKKKRGGREGDRRKGRGHKLQHWPSVSTSENNKW